MTIFAVLMPTPQAELILEISKLDHISLNETQYLVSFGGTVVELSAHLGMTDPNKATTGAAVLLATSSYYGRAPSNTWDWMKAKLESPTRG